MKCELGFYVICGLKEDFCVEYCEGKKSGGIVVGFYDEYIKLWERVIFVLLYIYLFSCVKNV